LLSNWPAMVTKPDVIEYVCSLCRQKNMHNVANKVLWIWKHEQIKWWFLFLRSLQCHFVSFPCWRCNCSFNIISMFYSPLWRHLFTSPVDWSVVLYNGGLNKTEWYINMYIPSHVGFALHCLESSHELFT